MKQIVTIKGKPVIEIYESFNGSYWYVTEKAWKQDRLISGKVYKQDQILFGYVRLANWPQFAEFGYFSEAELKRLGWRVWKVHKQDWCVCPDVEVEEIADEPGHSEEQGQGTHVPQLPSDVGVCEEVALQ